VTAATTDLVDDRLASVHLAVRRAMLDSIPDGEPHPWLYRLTRAYPSRPGKALRPALCLAAAGAFGGRAVEVMPAAVAIELLHNAFLVHDDIVDGSILRRGRPTLSAEYGTALALNTGDALAVLANRALRHYARDLDRDLSDRLQAEFEVMALRTLEGQATELGWRHDDVRDLTPEHYLDLIMHKTCWYTTIHPLRVGALLGSQGSADLRPMVRFGFHLGAAFQIQDDLLNLEGDERESGKEIDGEPLKPPAPIEQSSIGTSDWTGPNVPQNWSARSAHCSTPTGVSTTPVPTHKASPTRPATRSKKRSLPQSPVLTSSSSGH
jgi:geranylgeranyl diphosphate synthase type II